MQSINSSKNFLHPQDVSTVADRFLLQRERYWAEREKEATVRRLIFPRARAFLNKLFERA